MSEDIMSLISLFCDTLRAIALCIFTIKMIGKYYADNLIGVVFYGMWAILIQVTLS